jgi:hypothetical protein
MTHVKGASLLLQTEQVTGVLISYKPVQQPSLHRLHFSEGCLVHLIGVIRDSFDREVSGMYYGPISSSLLTHYRKQRLMPSMFTMDPINSNFVLHYLCEHKWDTAAGQKKKTGKIWGSMSSLTLTAIGVHSLVDKLEVEGLRVCAIDQISSLYSPSNAYQGAAALSDMSEVINAHYVKCVQNNYAMGRKHCLSIIKWMPGIAKLESLIDLAKSNPNLAMDMYFADCENDGKLW